MPASEVSITAEILKQFTLTFDLNGGTMDGETGIVTKVLEEGTVITLAEPTKEGYEFQYWEGSRYNAGDEYKVTEDHKFTAQGKETEPETRETKPESPDVKPGTPETKSGTSDAKPGTSGTSDTSDHSNVSLWMIILIISLIGILGGAIVIKRKFSNR